nr:TfoX/Sxy family protein [Sphingomonas chungangi]
MVREALGDTTGITEKAMFGGLCWLLDGHLLCAASQKGMMVRLGKGEDGWALAHPEIVTVTMGERTMPGWVRVPPGPSRDDDMLRRNLIDKAVTFVARLSSKPGLR